KAFPEESRGDRLRGSGGPGDGDLVAPVGVPPDADTCRVVQEVSRSGRPPRVSVVVRPFDPLSTPLPVLRAQPPPRPPPRVAVDLSERFPRRAGSVVVPPAARGRVQFSYP